MRSIWGISCQPENPYGHLFFDGAVQRTRSPFKPPAWQAMPAANCTRSRQKPGVTGTRQRRQTRGTSNHHRLQKTHPTAADCLELAMVEAASTGDRNGLALFSELMAQRVGPARTAATLKDLPMLVDAGDVAVALRTIHGEERKEVSEAVIVRAVHQLAAVGVTPGEEISYSKEDGVPVLWMSCKVHAALKQVAPHALHLLTPFLRVE